MFHSMSKPARNGVSHVFPHCCAVDAMAVVPPTPKPSLGRRSIFPGHKDFAASFHLVDGLIVLKMRVSGCFHPYFQLENSGNQLAKIFGSQMATK